MWIGDFKRAGKKEIFQKTSGSAVSRTREDKAGISSKRKDLTQMREGYPLLKKKNGLGLTGDLPHKKLSHAARKELIKVIDNLKKLTIAKACEVLKLNARCYYRWSNRPKIPAIKRA